MAPIRKKARSDAPAIVVAPPTQPAAPPSSVFAPFRAMGTVCNDVPFDIQALGSNHFMTTAVGNAFHVYNVDKFRLMIASGQTPEPITALGSFRETTYAACRNVVHTFARGKLVGALASPDIDGAIFQLLVLGTVVLALSDDNRLTVWDAKSGEVTASLDFGPTFTASCFMHPHTYLNKVVIGSSQGSMQLWNVSSSKLIYEFAAVGSPVCTLAQSPVVDVVAIGLVDGHIHLHNLRLDERIASFHQDSRVTAISFRTDADASMMATASHLGDIAVWDLEKRRLVHQVKGAHSGAIPSLQFLVGQPLLITSGADNAIKQFVFDSPDGVPRLLKFRSGHAAPPTMVRFYDDEGKSVLTAGKDRTVRLFSIVRDAQSVEFSQGVGTGTAAGTGTHATKGAKRLGIALDQLRLPNVTAMATCEKTQRDWDNVVTAHESLPEARVWSYRRKALSETKLPTTDGATVKAVTLTPCGNFAVLGSALGHVDVYNVQSGKFRRSFVGGHTKAVTSIVVDRINQYAVTSSLDRTVKVWDFASGKEVYSVPLPAPVTQLVAHLDNELIALVSDDLAIRVLDLEARRIVREFWGHRNRITDVCFAPDGRWLVSASLDATVRTWDLPTGFLIDQFRVDHVVTSVAFSPVGDFLATAHVDTLAINLWSNKSMYTTVALRPLTEEDEAVEVALPTAAGFDDEEEEDSTAIDGADAAVTVAAQVSYSDYVTPHQLTDKMITMSAHPKSRWQMLLNLDSVKARNKPKAAPRAPERAPFFLPTVSGIVTSFAPDATTSVDDDGTVRGLGNMSLDSEFIQLLKSCDDKRNYGPLLANLIDMSPSAIDLEIRMLSELHLESFIRALMAHIKTRQAWELGQAWLNVFLKVHGEALSRSDDARALLADLARVHDAEWTRVQAQLRYTNCMLEFVRY